MDIVVEEKKQGEKPEPIALRVENSVTFTILSCNIITFLAEQALPVVEDFFKKKRTVDTHSTAPFYYSSTC